METTRLYWNEPLRRSAPVRVTDVRDTGVCLDQTIFYPTGGGQPHDHGTLATATDEWAVTDVTQTDDIIHQLDGQPPAVGTELTATLAWERRWGHMRHHTAQHLLSAIMLDDFDAPTVGNQLYADRARLDCEIERLDQESLDHIEATLNDYIDDDRPVTTKQLARTDAEERLDPNRTRLDLLPASVDPVRIVDIAGIDKTACGGTHVESTGDIGTITVTGRETAGSGRERIHFEAIK